MQSKRLPDSTLLAEECREVEESTSGPSGSQRHGLGSFMFRESANESSSSLGMTAYVEGNTGLAKDEGDEI